MSASTMKHLHAALMVALMTLTCAAAAQDITSTTAIRYGTTPALDCKQVSKTGAPGRWMEANGAAVEGIPTRRMRLSFNNPVATDMIHATMNGAGARELALVEVQDRKGDWQKVWEGEMMPPAPGFEQTCFEQQLPKKQVVQAMRFTFRSAQDEVEVNHAALLRR
ncbi:hypothetical protein [Massilia aerilata]|uniref:F5/8 type C domain-containing protein n=1 Tax=Massilia aerilata TaxID=453817 RepID=A0ABW0S1R2_9BURK